MNEPPQEFSKSLTMSSICAGLELLVNTPLPGVVVATTASKISRPFCLAITTLSCVYVQVDVVWR